MNTELKPEHGQQEPSPATPTGGQTGENASVTTSSGIRFSLPAWAEADSAAHRSPEPEQAGSASPFEVQYF